ERIDLPWELIYLHGPGGADDGGLFLGELGLTRTRWNVLHPKEIALAGLTRSTVIPTYPDALALDGAEMEGWWLEDELDAEPVAPVSARALLRHLQQRERMGVLHYAGHGAVDDAD